MLRFLSIRHLAVIETLEVAFEPGLTVLTGETGAGKSILVGAVGLLLGGRASSDFVRTGEEQATVQAVFELDGREVIVRREVTSQGRSRAFVDGSLATASALKDLAARLVDLHGQHEHQALLDPHGHLDVLDAYAALGELRGQVAEAFCTWRSLGDELASLERLERDKAARVDFLTYQLVEIDRVGPRPGEDEELGATRELLANADKVQRLCEESYARLYESDDAVLSRLGAIWRRVAELAELDPAFGAFLEGRDIVKTQLEELARFLRTYATSIDASPERLQQIEDRLALLERLKRKYGGTLDEVLRRQAASRTELEHLAATAEHGQELRARQETARRSFMELATRLSEVRRTEATRFERALEAQLADLAMQRTRFEVRFNADPLEEGEWTERGIDQAEFYVSPNPGEDLRPLARIASGGELSRMMLALKTLASIDSPDKTLIFDEVDAGIGGQVADAVGRKLQRLGAGFQVLCITHLPQIAAFGSSHYGIEKSVRAGRTTTSIVRLEGERRVDELARMIGGATVTPSTRSSARELLGFRQQAKGESEAKTKGESRRTRQS